MGARQNSSRAKGWSLGGITFGVVFNVVVVMLVVALRVAVLSEELLMTFFQGQELCIYDYLHFLFDKI